MNEADKNRFAEVMTGLAENFGSSLSKPGLSMRFEALKNYSIEEVERAAFSIMQSRKYTNMPTVAEFMEHLSGGSAEDIAQVEATKVLEAIRNYGPYETVAFDNPVTQAVIQYSFGGWQKLNEELREDQEKWFIKDFEKSYKAFSKQNMQYKGALPGIVQHNNEVLGKGKIPQPKLIGDQQKAKQIALEKNPESHGTKHIGKALDSVMSRQKEEEPEST